MSATAVFTCDGKDCGKTIDLKNVVGVKIVVGCPPHKAPKALLHFCPSCEIPGPEELAKAKPWQIIKEIREITPNGRVPQWLGSVHYNPDLGAFTDGYGDEPLM